jgi:uncharacterized membrane protein (Fun14 family)
MIDVFSPILIQLGFGGIGGFFVGYLLKKVLKFALMIGVIAFIFTYFAYESYMEIDYAQLISRAEQIATPAINFIYPLISQLPAISSLVVGAVIGFTKS